MYKKMLINCACGCGIEISSIDTRGRTVRYKDGHQGRAPKPPGFHGWRWKGGIKIDKSGYIMVRCPGHPRIKKYPYVREHILIMEKHIGRYLTMDECIHHINGDKQDNRIENLKLMSIPDHMRLHMNLRYGNKP